MPPRRHYYYHSPLLVVVVVACIVCSASIDGFSAVAARSTTALLVTFDLDDTLFPVGPVVADANAAMIRYMRARPGYEDFSEDGYLRACREIRTELYEPGVNIPMPYSELRRCAIARESARCVRGRDAQDGTTLLLLAQEAFAVWLTERHAAAERHLFPDAVPMLRAVRRRYGNDCVIGAVTNGRGNPLVMESSLRPYFDFCVSGEDDDVFPERKPHPGIFEAALARARAVRGDNEDFTCWIHVGDDLANDVGASAACGAQAVWMDVASYLQDTTARGSSFFLATASEDERERRRRSAEAARGSVTATITRLSDLPCVVDDIVSGRGE